MSKKAHKENYRNFSSFDFSSLLSYCKEEQKEKFRSGLSQPPVSSLILNTKRNNDFLAPFLSSLRKDEKDSLLYRFDKEENRIGKTVEHFAGCFYILDPSSAAISYYLSPLLKKNFVSIDLCAAPGGKTIALQCRRNDGLFLANDIAFDRANEIVKNAERLGLDNVLTLSIDPMKLKGMEECFDLVILDVPCSGSGMIRKEPKMKDDWSKEKMERLLPIQKDLLNKAYELLSADGIIAYSTCSLSIEEDENQVKDFLSSHPDMEEIRIDAEKTMIEGINHCGYHLVPGLYDGEGIYFALLRKKGGKSTSLQEVKYEKYLGKNPIISYKKNEYVVSRFYSFMKDLPFLSPGLKLYDFSEYKKCDFDHASSKIKTDVPICSLDHQQAISYACGNEVNVVDDSPDGLVILSYQGYPLGYGKKQGKRIKNYLPKGLRGNLL